jgi:hypothetical protein
MLRNIKQTGLSPAVERWRGNASSFSPIPLAGCWKNSKPLFSVSHSSLSCFSLLFPCFSPKAHGLLRTFPARFEPRVTLGIPGGDRRLDRILALIQSCPYSVHGLSRVEMDRTPPPTPRFNMPCELGLTITWQKLNPTRHTWFVFEAQRACPELVERGRLGPLPRLYPDGLSGLCDSPSGRCG